MLTMHGSRTESIGAWWESGWYATAVRRPVARAAGSGSLPAPVPAVFPTAEHLADTAAGHPDLLDGDTLAWITEAIHTEESLLRDARLPAPPAVAVLGWAAQDLLDILRSGSEGDESPGTPGLGGADW